MKMNNDSHPVRYKRVLVVDDDETDIYISKRIIKSTSFADEVVTTTSAQGALDYLRLNMTTGILPEMIFIGLNVISKCGMDFMNEYSSFAEKANINCGITLMMNVIGFDKFETKKVKTHPHIRFLIEKPLTREALWNIK